MRVTKRQLRKIIREVFQSHTREPTPGDKIVNVNPTCTHFQSRGVVDRIEELPEDQGKVVVYVTTKLRGFLARLLMSVMRKFA